MPAASLTLPTGLHRGVASPLPAADTATLGSPAAVAFARRAAFAESAGASLAFATMATLGALWGAVLLVRIAAGGSFTALGIHEVNAHGHAQVFGWVGGVWMAMMLGGVPGRRGLTAAAPARVAAIVGTFAAGVVLRSGAGPWAGTDGAAFAAGMAGHGLETAAIVATLAAARPVLASRLWASDPFLAAASWWCLAQSVLEAAHFAATALAPDRAALLHVVATWQAPLRDVQIHGFGLMLALGLTLEFLAPRPLPRAARATSARDALLLVLLAEIGGFLLMRAASYRWAIVWEAAVIALAVVVVGVLRGARLPARPWRARAAAEGGRALALAHAWLLLALAMLVVLPLHQFVVLRLLAPEGEAVRLGFSHAYYGAIRHAVTVGYLSQVLVLVLLRDGVGAACAPLRRASLLALNVGCGLRVGGQVLTDLTPAAFLMAAPSGMLEWLALAGLAAVWWRGRRELRCHLEPLPLPVAS